MSTSDLTVAVIAGGKSVRMGTDKAFLPFNGKPMIEQLLDKTAGLGQSETLIIANQEEAYAPLGLPIYGDLIPEKGSLGGIYTALHFSQTPYTLALACDMPFVSVDLLRYMIGLAADDAFDVIVPRVEKYPEALHAIYHKNCLEPIHAKIEAGRLKIIGFYGQVRVRYLDEEEYEPFDREGRSFMNLNTPEELEKARGMVGSNEV